MEFLPLARLLACKKIPKRPYGLCDRYRISTNCFAYKATVLDMNWLTPTCRNTVGSTVKWS